MKQLFFAIVLVSSFLATVPVRTQASCDVTVNNTPESYDNRALRLFGLWPEGTVVFKPGGPGFILRDGALAMKFGWWRLVPGNLTITGRRLDGEAPSARARVPAGYGDVGFQSTGIAFPTPGSWEITGHIGSETLSFVIRVVKIDAGPSGRDDW